jgi:hypothetical protein
VGKAMRLPVELSVFKHFPGKTTPIRYGCTHEPYLLTDQRDLCRGNSNTAFVCPFLPSTRDHWVSLVQAAPFFFSPPAFANQALSSSYLLFSFHHHWTTWITCYLATFLHLTHTHSIRQDNADPERHCFYNSCC